jgi:hypothetical protein
MADYLWPSVAAVVLLGAALWSYLRLSARRRRAVAAFAAAEDPLRRRRDAAADLAGFIRTFRSSDAARFERVESLRRRAVEADSAPDVAERRAVESEYSRELLALLAVASTDVLLKSHDGARRAAGRLAAVHQELRAALARFHAAAADYRRRAAAFPNSLVLHVLDLPPLEDFDIGLGDAAG